MFKREYCRWIFIFIFSFFYFVKLKFDYIIISLTFPPSNSASLPLSNSLIHGLYFLIVMCVLCISTSTWDLMFSKIDNGELFFNWYFLRWGSCHPVKADLKCLHSILPHSAMFLILILLSMIVLGVVPTSQKNPKYYLLHVPHKNPFVKPNTRHLSIYFQYKLRLGHMYLTIPYLSLEAFVL